MIVLKAQISMMKNKCNTAFFAGNKLVWNANVDK